MRTRLVVKLVVVLVLLLAVVLYKMNDFYAQEKLYQAESSARKQILLTKTAVSGQISSVRNVLSSFEIEIKENQINWVQLNPFFALARLQKKADGSYQVLQFVGRSGGLAERWNNSYLEKALSLRRSKSDEALQTKLFKDRAGNKFLTLIFNFSQSSGGSTIAAITTADYFQKYFDLDRGGRLTSALVTSDQILAAHTEPEYIGTLTDENQLPAKKYILAQEEIAGTNLMALSYVLKKSVTGRWMVPWSVVGLIFGFGFVLIGLLLYGLDPLEKKIERYKKQERETIFNEVVQSELHTQTQSASAAPLSESNLMTGQILNQIDKTKEESVERAQEVFAEPPAGQRGEATLNGPLQQALFNLDSLIKQSHIAVEKDISTGLVHFFYYAYFIKAFENIIRNSIEALSEKTSPRKIIVRAYDVDLDVTVVEIQDNGTGGSQLADQPDKVWQPFFTTKLKSQHMGLGLTEARSIMQRCGAQLHFEPLPTEGVLVKMIMRKEKENAVLAEEIKLNPKPEFKPLLSFTQPQIQFKEDVQTFELSQNAEDIDLDQILSLDSAEIEPVAVEKKPSAFSMNRKNYDVDQLSVVIRRPEKS